MNLSFAHASCTCDTLFVASVQNQTSLNWFYLWFFLIVLIPITLLGARGIWKKNIQLVHCCTQLFVFLLTIFIAGVIPQAHSHVSSARAVRSSHNGHAHHALLVWMPVELPAGLVDVHPAGCSDVWHAQQFCRNASAGMLV